MPLTRLPSSSSTTTQLRKPMSTGPTHSLESLMDNMPDPKVQAKAIKKTAKAKVKSNKKLGA